VCSDWAKQVAAIMLKKAKPVLTVGSLDAEIDFSDVRDVVRAYRAILDKGKKGEAYNVCSGRAVSLEYILKYLIDKSGIAIDVQSLEIKKRAHVTSPKLVGDNTRLKTRTGWQPEISIEQTLNELLEYWKQELQK
jgi:GDP-4-dehydro-6-deoxy-D-mannose reductase